MAELAVTAVTAVTPPVRIARVGGRFLVFDVADVARLRRQHGICGVLVGVTPQAPNQGVFSGLPLELAPDEVAWLVQRRAARVDAQDDTTAHLAGLASPVARRRYLANVTRQRQAAQAAADAEAAERQRRTAEIRKAKRKPGKPEGTGGTEGEGKPKPDNLRKNHQVRVTPTTSDGLLEDGQDGQLDPELASPLRSLLADGSYFVTPGLRFGGDLSVYPGDPFRYHAHFVATGYGWDEPIALLDLVGTGRLATGVKKGLLIGGEGDEGVRTFTLEWAAI